MLEEHLLGVSWVREDEPLQRASHALATDGGVWLVDPVDVPEALAAAEARGPVVGVLQLLDRHPRDCASLAARHGVAHLRLPDAVPGAPFEVIDVISVPRWREKALWWPEHRALVVAELVGTAPAYAVGDGRIGVHPMLRLPAPVGALRDRPAEWVLCGHGAPVHGPGTEAALRVGLDRARRDLPKLAVKLPGLLLAMRGGG